MRVSPLTYEVHDIAYAFGDLADFSVETWESKVMRKVLVRLVHPASVPVARDVGAG
jgi:hypothetical protein